MERCPGELASYGPRQEWVAAMKGKMRGARGGAVSFRAESMSRWEGEAWG